MVQFITTEITQLKYIKLLLMGILVSFTLTLNNLKTGVIKTEYKTRLRINDQMKMDNCS